MIVHSGNAEVGIGEVGNYAAQVRRSDVFTVTSYGEFHIYRIDPHKALLLYQDAMQAVKALVDYLREQLVTNDGWLQSLQSP